MTSPPTIDDVVAATRRLDGRAVVTPLLNAPEFDTRIGGRVFIKAEALQRTGSFKFRGATNKISRLSEAEKSPGIVAYSSGNHAQAVAAAAAVAGVPATIVMPADAAAAYKAERARSFGAKVIGYNRETEDRIAIARGIADESGATIVPPYDDPDVIAGQGTVGLEIANQSIALAATPDAILVPCSGGGLAAGTAIAIRQKIPGCAVHTVEPENYDDTARSLAADSRLSNGVHVPTLCDALQVKTPGELTFSINRCLLAPGIVVTDTEVRDAMRAALDIFKLVLEPGGAVGLAAVLSGRFDAKGRTTVVVASGGNIAPEAYAQILS